MDKESRFKKITVEKLPLEAPGQSLGIITLNQPELLNPLDWNTVKELRKAIRALSSKRRVRVIAITGNGKAFCSGGDLKGYLTLYRDKDGFRTFLHDLHETFDIINKCAQPVIALVNGYSVAGGLELLLACDFAYAAKSAKIGDGHVNFGQVGGAGSNVRLPRCILPSKARELLFTGKLISAREALKLGIVNCVVPNDKLIQSALEFANVIASKSPLGIQLIKNICNVGLNLNIDKALEMEMEQVHTYATSSHDSYEGLLAFVEKRKPRFKGV